MPILVFFFYFCSVNLLLNFANMEKESVFNEFRKWFNQMFSLSFDGKFKGLSTLCNLYGARFVEHLKCKLLKAMKHNASGYLRYASVLCLRISGHTNKLYS